MYYTIQESPVGDLLILAVHDAICGLYCYAQFHSPKIAEQWSRDDVRFDNVRHQLQEYFEGHRQAFDLTLAPIGSAFQLCVWQQLLQMPYGQTTSYGEIARQIGNPAGSRAVGLANGRNPISIIVPCHRVIGANGALTGYGGGLDAKRWLLRHEATICDRSSNATKADEPAVAQAAQVTHGTLGTRGTWQEHS